MNTANLVIIGVMILMIMASALWLYRAGGKSQKAETADQDVQRSKDEVQQIKAMDQRRANAPKTTEELLDVLDKGQA